MLIILFCLIWLGALLFPQTSAARAFHKLLVETPARAIAKLTPGRAALTLIVVAASLTVVALMKGDGAILLAQGLPEGVGWLVTFDIASYVDAGLVVAAAAGAAALRGALRLAIPPRKPRAARTPRRSRPRRQSTDPDPSWRGSGPVFA